MKAVPLPVWHLGWRGQVFQVQRPFQFCCLPNNSFALTDKPEEILYLLNERGQIMARGDFTGQGQLGALSCDKDNRIYMTRYETNYICIFDASGECLRTISLSCILKKPKAISVMNEEAVLVANSDQVVLLSLKWSGLLTQKHSCPNYTYDL